MGRFALKSQEISQISSKNTNKEWIFAKSPIFVKSLIKEEKSEIINILGDAGIPEDKARDYINEYPKIFLEDIEKSKNKDSVLQLLYEKDDVVDFLLPRIRYTGSAFWDLVDIWSLDLYEAILWKGNQENRDVSDLILLGLIRPLIENRDQKKITTLFKAMKIYTHNGWNPSIELKNAVKETYKYILMDNFFTTDECLEIIKIINSSERPMYSRDAIGIYVAEHFDNISSRLNQMPDETLWKLLKQTDSIFWNQDSRWIEWAKETKFYKEFGLTPDEMYLCKMYKWRTKQLKLTFLRDPSMSHYSHVIWWMLLNKVLINKIPPEWEGIFWRGVGFWMEKFKPQCEGDIWTDKGFTGTSRKRSVAEEFCNWGGILFKIKGKSCRSIEGLDPVAHDKKDEWEAEYLFPIWTKFKVLWIDKTWFNTIVELEEIDK